MAFGTLLFEDEGGVREHPLTGAVMGLGRDPSNEISLPHPTISRFHARIVSDAGGSRIADLGSGNGTKVDGVELEAKVERPLTDGSQVAMGQFILTYRAPRAAGAGSDAHRDVSRPVPQPLLFASEDLPRLAVSTTTTTAQGAREVPLTSATMFLGRDPSNDIVVEADSVSRRHARLDRRDSGWEITDLGSTNGLVFQGRPIQNRTLADGDVINIGASVSLQFRHPQPAGVQASGGVLPARPRETTFDLPARGPLVLGRGGQADVALSHPQISRAHAQIVRLGSGLVIEDLGSAGGTYVNGEQIRQHPLAEGDVVRIGPSRLVLDQGRLRVVDEQGDIRIDAFNLRRVVGKGLRILQDVSLSIYPQEFVAIVGGSGAGKSTLLKALCGFQPADAGVVLLNGVDLYRQFDAYRNDLGYVPQDDIIHRELSIFHALDYAAQLRMPGDTTVEERRQRIYEVLQDLDLVSAAGRAVRQLSGGQRKRVSIGVELLTKPSLFFLDEATSGLDPGTELQMMRLLRRLADQGRTVALVTHATKNVMTCDKVAFMARGGNLAYYGPPEEALRYFGVDDFDEIYNRLDQGDPQSWAIRYRGSRQYTENVESRLAEVAPTTAAASQQVTSPTQSRSAPTPPPVRVSSARQFLVLSKRYLDTIWRDKRTTVLLFALAPVLGLLDFVVWKRDTLDIQTGDANRAVIMVFMACIISILVGTITSVREIVKEDAVYRRERMVGLRVMPYISSKVLIGFVFALYSGFMLFAIKLGAINMSQLGAVALFQIFLAMVLGTFAGVMWGLLVSAVAPSEDRAMLLVILVLIPQFMFSGAMVPLSDLGIVGRIFGTITSTRWQFGAMVTSMHIEGGAHQAPDLSDVTLPGIQRYPDPVQKQSLINGLHNQYGDIFHVNLSLYLGMCLAITVVLLTIITLLQRRKDTL